MIRTFLTTTYRSIIKNPLVSTINLASFALAIGCSIVCFQFLYFQYSMDDFHDNREEIYLVTHQTKRSSSKPIWAESPWALGPRLKSSFEQVSKMTWITEESLPVRKDGELFNQTVQFVHSDFFEMFTFPLQEGTTASFEELQQAIISEEEALKLFGNTKVIGKPISVAWGPEGDKEFFISGVLERIPSNSSFRPSILLPVSSILDVFLTEDDWTNSIITFIQLDKNSNPQAVGEGLDPLIKLQAEADPGWAAIDFPLIPLTEVSEREEDIGGFIFVGTSKLERRSILILSIILLVLACLNYMNIAMNAVHQRLKEIGVRKSMGASKKELIIQFVAENIFFTCLAFALGILLAGAFFIPGFRVLFGYQLELVISNGWFWLFSISLVILVGALSALYPSMYISSFKPSQILKGKLKRSKQTLSRVFMGVQFGISILCLTASASLMMNTHYLSNKDWGYETSNLLVIPNIYDPAKRDQLILSAKQDPAVQSVSTSQYHIGTGMGWGILNIEGEQQPVYSLGVGEDFFQTLEIEKVSGRLIDPSSASDKSEYVNVNEAFIEAYGLQDGYEDFTFKSEEGKTYRIAGVVADFHFYPFYHKITPVYLYIPEQTAFTHIWVKSNSGKSAEVMANLESNWKDIYPDRVFGSFYQGEVFEEYLGEVGNHRTMMLFIGGLSIIISCLGLFGLVTLDSSFRMKEFSIRKIMGAGIADLVHSLNKNVMGVLLVSLLISLPLSYFLVDALLSELYTFYLPVNIIQLFYTCSFLLLVTVITLYFPFQKVWVSNPTDFIKED